MSAPGPLGATPQGATPQGAFEPGGPFERGGALHLGARTALRATAPRATASRTRAGLAGLGGLLLAACVISVSAAHTDLLLPESVRPVPDWLAGPLGGAGVGLSGGGLILVLVLMLGSYVLAVRAADRLSPRTVLITIATLHALMLLAPPLLSTDAFSYQAYARMWALLGTNPYLQGPHVLGPDPLSPFIGAKWVATPTAYGPIFTALSYLLAPLSIAASAFSYKAIAALASLATVALVSGAARLRGLNPVKAAALVGLNPLLVVYGVGGGHNDLWMLAAIAAGLYALLAQRRRTGGALLVIAAGIKLTAGLLLPFALAAGSGLGARDRRRSVLIGAGAGAAGVCALSLAIFGTGPMHLLGTLQKVQGEGDWHSIPGLITTRLGLGTLGHLTSIGLAAIFAGVLAWLLRRVWRGEMDWIDGAGWATVALLITASSTLPWYVAWLLPLAALGTDRRLWRTAIVMTCVIQGIQLLGYLPHRG
ncbi:MAG: hypothetical protein DLM64_05485 [Solirubrobacterales bacterium]|nr:MAG: hypothetical protein DLM64_05485 [Solirubrobacterales bacterium]